MAPNVKTAHIANADVFTAIAHPIRREILERLAVDEADVQALAAHFATTRSAVSQHLSILRQTGLVESRKDGRHRIYRLEPTNLSEIFTWIAQFEQFWEGKLDALADYLDSLPKEGA